MIIFSVVLYLICIGIFFFGNNLLRKISVFAWVGISLIFAIINIANILLILTYLLIAAIGFIAFVVILIRLDFLKENSKKLQMSNIKIPSISDKNSENSVDVIGSVEEFIITVYVKGKRFDFKVINGEIASYKSNKMRDFANYEVQDDEK